MAAQQALSRGYQLCQAVEWSSVEYTNILLSHDDCDTFMNEAWEMSRDKHFTAVMWAAVLDRDEILKLLIHKRAKLDLQDALNGQSALVLAARKGNTEIMRILVEAGASVPLLTTGVTDGVNALMAAASEGQAEAVKVLLEYGLQDVNARSSKCGYTALWLACVRGRLSVVRILLDHGGADAGLADWARGWTPWEAAKQEGHQQCYLLVEEVYGRPYTLHRARCVRNNFETHKRFPDKALPRYIQGRIEQKVSLPKVEVVMKRKRNRRIAKDLRIAHGPGKQVKGEKRKEMGDAIKAAKKDGLERTEVIKHVVEQLSEELYAELMMGLMHSGAGLSLKTKKKQGYVL